MDNHTIALIAEYTRRYMPQSAEQRGIRRIIRLQNAADTAAWDIAAAQRELASTANPCVWQDIYRKRRILDVTMFRLNGGYRQPACKGSEPVDPFYAQARRNATK